FGDDVERMEIQQVSLDGEGIGPERRPVPYVGDRIKTFIPHPGTSDVNAILGRQLLVAAQIDGRDRVLGAAAVSPACGGQNAERPGQKVARAADTSLRDKLAEVAAGNRFAAQAHFGIDLDLK